MRIGLVFRIHDVRLLVFVCFWDPILFLERLRSSRLYLVPVLKQSIVLLLMLVLNQLGFFTCSMSYSSPHLRLPCYSVIISALHISHLTRCFMLARSTSS